MLKFFVKELLSIASIKESGFEDDYCIIVIKRHASEELRIRVCKIKTPDPDFVLFTVKNNAGEGFAARIRFMWIVSLGLVPCLLARAFYKLKK